MSNWEELTFNDVLEIISGKNQKHVTDPNGQYPIYGSAGIFGRATQYLCNAGTTIIGRKGTIDTPLYVNEKFWNVDTAFGLSPLEHLDSKFLFYFCLGFNFKTLDKSTTIPSLAKRDLLQIKISIPSLNEQKRIVAKIEELFSELDKGIESLKYVQEQLKIYRQSILKNAFEGKLTAKWREENSKNIVCLENRIEEIKIYNLNKTGGDIPSRLPPISLNDLPNIPNTWIWIEAHKVCSSVRDGTHDTPKYVSHGVPLVTSKNLKNGQIDFSDIQYISSEDHNEISKRSHVSERDVLFGMIGTIGNPVIIKGKEIFSIKNVGIFKIDDKYIMSEFLAYFLSSFLCENIMSKKELIRGTTQKFVGLGGLRVLPLPLPCLLEQQQIVTEIEEKFSVIDQLEQDISDNLKRADVLRQAILKKAFSGKLVDQDPNDEPASVLLERIAQEKTEGRACQTNKEKGK